MNVYEVMSENEQIRESILELNEIIKKEIFYS